MKQLIYRIIYSPRINKILRSINKVMLPILPNKVKIPPSGTLILENGNGSKLAIKLNQTNYLGWLIYWEGGYKKFEYTSIFESLIKKVDSFYDIGANIGYYSLIASMENPTISVFGFEPAQGPLFFFKKNVEINEYKNIRILDLAISQKEGSIEFYEIKNKKYSYLEHNLAGESNAGSLTEGRNFVKNIVPTKTLDQFYKEQGENIPIDLIKIDTEGTEYLILQNAEEVLSKMQPIIICEVLFGSKEKELEASILKHGYEIFAHIESGLEKVDTLIRQNDNHIYNFFFVPSSKIFMIKEYLN